MKDPKIQEIKKFYETNSDPEIIKKYSRYFRDGYDGYGIDKDLAEKQITGWIERWKGEMNIDRWLDLGDELFRNGRYDEKHLAIRFIMTQREHYSKETFNRIGKWFDYGVNNWATTDVLCMTVLTDLMVDHVIDLNDLKSWNDTESEWQRRAVPVTLIELVKKGMEPDDALNTIKPLMPDKSEYVQKGIGTLLREIWKKHPGVIEDFLMEWKDSCGRLIVQYATEKMDKEYRKRFRKSK